VVRLTTEYFSRLGEEYFQQKGEEYTGLCVSLCDPKDPAVPSGRALTYSNAVQDLHFVLRKVGVDPTGFTEHSMHEEGPLRLPNEAPPSKKFDVPGAGRVFASQRNTARIAANMIVLSVASCRNLEPALLMHQVKQVVLQNLDLIYNV